MQICELKKLTGGRYLVSLEGDIRFPLYGKEMEELGICEESGIKESDYRMIMEELLPKRACLCAMHYLQSMDRTEHQLRTKLQSLFYPEEIVEHAVRYVKGYHYIDDVRYAASYMEYRKDSRSIRQMEQELYRKGISKESFQEALQQVEMPDEERQIRQWLEKKHYMASRADRRETERIYRFLLRKGYSATAIGRVMRLESLYE